MDTKSLFQTISRKMRADFDASSEINHHGSRGTVRENKLRNFLAEGRLPGRYGLGAGEVVGRVRDTSRQCDVVIYDKYDGVMFIYDESVQVFPIDCVYGIIEVKSSLSKTELIDALDKIAAFKEMTPTGMVSQPAGGGFTTFHPRPRPFGAVFAYGLAGNSLNSLVDNLREWEAMVDPKLWPNYLCVLEAGVIYHAGEDLAEFIDSDKISASTSPRGLAYGQDSLFRFYCAIHDMSARMHLGPVELMRYSDPPMRIGKYIVHGRGMEGDIIVDGTATKAVRLKESTIDRVIAWCDSHGPMPYGDVLMAQYGSLPIGMEKAPILDMHVFLYNPENLPGMHEMGPDPFKEVGGRVTTSVPSLLTAISLVINDRHYVIAGLVADDYETVDNRAQRTQEQSSGVRP